MDLAVNSLKDYNAVEGSLKQFGKQKQRDFNEKHYMALCKSLMAVMQQEIGKLGPDWTPECK